MSQTPFAALLALLDDADIQRAAELWGLESMPGLRTRRELTDGLLELSAWPDRRSAVERKLGWDAKRVLGVVTELPAGQTTTLTEIADALDLDFGQPRAAERLRTALTELEESLLVWHTYVPDGRRALFQPIWNTATAALPQDREQAPSPVNGTPDSDAQVDRYALAWDLLTLLRWLGAGTPAVAPLSSATMRARRRFNELLWNAGAEEPLPGYLEFLAALADQGNLLDPPDAESRGNPAMRVWRSRSFAEQTAQLLTWWLSATLWIEAFDQEEVVVSGAHWPQFRRRLLVLLPEFDPNAWYRLDAVTHWLSNRSSDALGDTVQIATARPVDARLDRSVERLSSLEQVVERTLRSGFSWFRLVEIGHIPSVGEVIRVTETGRATAGVGSLPPAPDPIEPPLTVHPDLTVTLVDPSPVRIWSLTAFADQVRLQPQAEYRITNRSLKRALTAGFRVQDVETFLEKQSGEPLADRSRAELEQWAESLGRVWLTPAAIVQPEQEDDTQAVRTALADAGLTVSSMGPGLLVHGAEGMSAAALERQITTTLQEAGKSPQLRAAPDAFAGDDRVVSNEDPDR
ncbi:MAG: helicase-associated domain-containing protein [Thermomicrobiales bacterium]